MGKFRTLALVGVAFGLGFGSPVFAADDGKTVIAKVAGVEVTQAELDLAQANIDPQMSQLPEEQRKIAALAAIIDSKLLAAKAKAEGLDASESYKMRMQFLADRELHNAYFKTHIVDPVKDEDLKARYDAEVAKMPKEDEVRARHILVKTEDEAKAVIAELAGGKDFAAVAKEKSTDPNKSDGGDLGFFRKGQMVPEFEAAAYALAPGEVSKAPVKTQFGFHVIKVEEKRPIAPPPFDGVKEQVRQLVMREAYMKLLADSKKEAAIEIIDPALKAEYDKANPPAK